MNIKTKFIVNSLVQGKYEKEHRGMTAIYEVMEINTVTCYAGTQVFYVVRPMSIIKLEGDIYKNGKKTKEVHYSIGRATNKNSREGEMGYLRFREDELVVAKKELVDILLENS